MNQVPPSQLRHGMVITRHPQATRAGLQVLEEGGNAVDAAVTAAYALTVTTPYDCGVAGYGGCMLIARPKLNDVVAIDFNTRAPKAARSDMYPVERRSDGTISVPGELQLYGPLSVSVPGTVAGLCAALEQFGTWSRAAAIEPAIKLARQGFAVGADWEPFVWKTLLPRAARFPETFRLFLLNGHPARFGETMFSPELAETLEIVSISGPDAFYRGEIADRIVATVRAGDGILAREDMSEYQPNVCRPIKTSYRGHEIYTVPLATGGLTALQMLRLLERFDVPDVGGGVQLSHLLAEIAKVSFAERLLKYGDPDFIPINHEAELNSPLIDDLQRLVKIGLVAPKPGQVIFNDDRISTTDLVAADRSGTVVALTQTHGARAGSLTAVPGTGLILSHGMSLFDPRPGWPNSIAPRKRPLNNMSPLLVRTEDGSVIALSGSGGRTIMNSIASTVVRMLDLGATVQAAVEAPRIHVETVEPVQVEGGHLAAALRRLGHQVQLREKITTVSAIRIDQATGTMDGAGDPRGGSQVMWA